MNNLWLHNTFHLVLVEVEWVADGDVREDETVGSLSFDGGQEGARRHGVIDEACSLYIKRLH